MHGVLGPDEDAARAHNGASSTVAGGFETDNHVMGVNEDSSTVNAGSL